MKKESIFPSPPDRWNQLKWEKASDIGVFISKIEEGNVINGIPEYSVYAVRIDPGFEITPHRHMREKNWTERLTLPVGGNFEILGKPFKVAHQFVVTIHSNEISGLKNLDKTPLHFYSRMEPGFTGLGEIEGVKASRP